MSWGKKKNASKPYERVIFALSPATRKAFRGLAHRIRCSLLKLS